MNSRHFGTMPALGLSILLMCTASCSDDVNNPQQPTDNSISGQDVGIRQLNLSIPRLHRFDGVVNQLSCRIHLRGRNDRVSYPINTFISADKDSIYVKADDPILAELPHQMYHLNAITFPHPDVVTRSSAAEDTVYVGARLSIENPDNIHFRSSFNVGANSIGSGTESDPWIVASGDDFLLRISDPMTRGETHEGKYFEITRNLNLSTASVAYGKGWEPVGHNNINGGSTDFNGTIDGCDNYIENLYCFTDAGYGGLFYSLGPKAYIHNLEMRRVMLQGKDNLGAFACYAKQGCRLDSISVNGSIEGHTNVGGLIGNGDADIRVCISSVNVSATADSDCKNLGGMIGTSEHSIFTDCIRTGSINAPGGKNVGGFLGKGPEHNDNSIYASFERCYTGGSVSGAESVGGFIGIGNVSFNNCHAGATLPQDSYAYTIRWDVFDVNNRMTPVPLEVEASGKYAGGFAGYSAALMLQGENSFAYSSPAKPNIISNEYAGALTGRCVYKGDNVSKFTSNAYVKGNKYVGGVAGHGEFLLLSPVLTLENNGNVTGGDYTGGVVGTAPATGRTSFVRVNCKNTGNVEGAGYVGGVIGETTCFVENAIMQNDGNVVGSGNCVGGLFGASHELILKDESRVSSENRSIKIQGRQYVGGITGKGELAEGETPGSGLGNVYANIISTGGYAGGLFGYVKMHSAGARYSSNVFFKLAPMRVSITLNNGEYAGGAVGRFIIEGWSGALSINGFGPNQRASITTDGNYAGGLIGSLETNYELDINNCHVYGDITSTAKGDVLGYGGLFGSLNYTEHNGKFITVKGCSSHVNITGSTISAAAGMVGYFPKEKIEIRECYNAGRIEAYSSVGGIMGRLIGEGVIRDCFNMGDVVWKPNCTLLAGILGQKEDKNSHSVKINNCYNIGSTGWGIIGGESKSKHSISSCYYLNTASDGDMKNSGSKSKTADEMRRKSTYSGWDAGIWEFNEGTAAPKLKNTLYYDDKLPLQK